MLVSAEYIVAATSFMPQGTRYLWQPGLVSLHLVSDAITAVSYFSISLTLLYILRKWENIRFNRIFLLFATFIVFCGSSHLFDIWILWHPDYWVSGYIKAITAVISSVSAIALLNLIPQILTPPSPAHQLSKEIKERKQVQEALQEKEEFLRSIYEGVAESIFIVDIAENGEFIYKRLNPVHEMQTGIQSETVKGKIPEQVLTPEVAAAAKKRYQQCIDSRETIVYEECLPFQEQETWWLTTLKPLYDRESKIYRIVGTSINITERRKAEQALRDSEERWQLILVGTGDGIFDWNIITNEAFMSARLKEMLGYREDEIENFFQAWHTLLHPDDLENTIASLQAHINGKTPQYRVEYRLRCKDGSYKWILARGMAKWDETGKPIRMVGSHQDISLRKQTEAEIIKLNQELEQRVQRRTVELKEANVYKDNLIEREQAALEKIQIYEDIFQNLPVGLTIWNLENLDDLSSFCLVAHNPRASQILGVSLENFIGLRMIDCFPNILEDNALQVNTYAQVVRTKQVQTLEEVSYGDEQILQSFYDIKAFPLPENQLGIAFENVTQRKQMQQDLAESEHLYRTVVKSVKEVIFQIDTFGCWNFLSAAWTEITGLRVTESLHQPFGFVMYSEEDKESSTELFHSLIAGEKEDFEFEFRILTNLGNFHWLEMYARLNHNINGDMIGVYGTLNDVTERKKTEAVLKARADELARQKEELITSNLILIKTTTQLEKRNQELDQFAYVTSHDLKAPLRAIGNLSEWIEEDLEDVLTEDTKKQMNLLRGRVHRMEGLINGLLKYSRVGRIKSKLEAVAVDTLLREIIDLQSSTSEMSIEIEGEMPTFVTNKLTLTQVFSNLISNAIKHHHRSDGRIKISVREQEKFYEFAVSDDGYGIAPEYHEQIFAIFRTLEARDKKESTGIGLSIVKKIVESQGGRIRVESQVGQGSTFYFTWAK
ncbi:MAG: PAS domain S-box protein [Cyanobacteria bacterium P01_A01_bin.84]